MDDINAIEKISSGSETLDEILNGGIPENRSHLLTGGPGTGKTTFGMQFLQEGLRNDDTCLFISTEQKPPELRDTFAPFDFDFDHDGLSITSIHAKPGWTLESQEAELTIETLEGEQLLGEGFSAPFTSSYIERVLQRYAPADRIVIDSLSGLEVMSDDYNEFRRAVLDLITLFTDTFDATTIMVTEENLASETEAPALDPLQYTTHGVIRLWLEEVNNALHRYVQVRKMRGVNHDTRPYELEFDRGGIRIVPRQRSVPEPFIVDSDALHTGVPGLDTLLGGGFIRGETTVIEHDGRASVKPLVTAIATRTIAVDGSAVIFVPEASSRPEKVNDLFANQFDDIEALLAGNRLFVVDMISPETSPHDNIFGVDPEKGGLEYLFQLIDERSGDRPLVTMMNTEAPIRTLGEETITSLHEWQETNLLTGRNVTLYLHDPHTMTDELQEFFVNNAEQVLRTWLYQNGLQYITLKKSPTGYLGSTSLVEYFDTEPYLRVQTPPGHRETDT